MARPTPHGDRARRRAGLGDITILLPARTSLPALQVALAARGIPYRAENSSLVYAAPEVRALLLGPARRRRPDRRAGHRLRAAHPAVRLQRPRPVRLARHPRPALELAPGGARRRSPTIRSPTGCARSGALAERIPWSTPSELLAALVDERGVLELALATRHGRDVWRRVRFVIDQARAWSEAGGHGVRRYLTWTRLQGDDGRFVAETVLPETDHDAVRVMTVHAAKGLEFPVTIVSGLTTGRAARGPGAWCGRRARGRWPARTTRCTRRSSRSTS